MESSSAGMITLAKTKLSISKTGTFKELKKKYSDSKASFKKISRDRIYKFEKYVHDNLPAFIEAIYKPETSPLTFDISKLGEMEYNNVVQGLLVEFNMILFPFQVSSSFSSIEKELKKAIVSTLEKLGNIQSVNFDEHHIKERYNFCFEAAEEDLAESLRFLDECLAEFAMAWIGFLYVMQSFRHLFIDKGNLLGDELKLLIDKNNLETLQNEAFSLVSDYKLLEQIPDLVHVGLLSIDISEVKSFAKSSVTETIAMMFDPHIYSKFTSLLKTNRERYILLRDKLITPAPEIEQYIEMKRFLDSDEINQSLELIGQEIKLCRKLNQFEEQMMKADSKLINSEYLESLSWVNELMYHKDSAMRRTQEDLPRFKEELSRMSKKLQQDFNFTKASIKDFDEFIDDKEAELYYDKAVAVDSSLDCYLDRMTGINHKLEIIGEKKNLAFEKEILREKASFERFLDLWKFIATSWNVDHAHWKKEALSKLDKDEMEHVISNGNTLLSKLVDAFKDNELILKLVRNKSDEVRKFKVVLEVVKIMKNPNFKDRHWDELFNEIRLSDKNDSLSLREGRPDISKLTLEQLMIANITSHLKLLNNIISRATTEAETEKKIKEINYKIESITIKPTVFDRDNTVLSIIVSIKTIISQLNEGLSQCMNMLADPNNPEEFTRELNSLVKLLTLISTVLSMIQTLQNRLIQISPIFKFRDLERFLTKKETISQFVHIREEFKKIIYSIEEKQMRFFIEMIRSEDQDEKINEIQNKLRDLNTAAANVASNLKTFFKMIRIQSPRYFYTTDEQMMMLCSLIKFPKSLMGFVTYLFKGVSAISVGNHVVIPEMESIEINSVTNRAEEIMEFREPIIVKLAAHAEMPLISIVKSLEAGIKDKLDHERHTQLEILANYNFDFGLIFNNWSERLISYQVLCLSTHILFDFEISMILLASQHSRQKSTSGSNSIKSHLNKFKEKILDSIRYFVLSPIRVLKSRMNEAQAVNNLNHYVQLVMGFVGVLDYLILNDVSSSQTYDFQIIPKYSVIFNKHIKVQENNEDKVAYDELQYMIDQQVNPTEDSKARGGYACYSQALQGYFKDKNNKIVLTMMDQTIEYKYEITNPNRNIAVWPLFERTSFSLFMAITNCPFIILKGFANQGKLETTRAIGNKVAANYYECDMAFNYDMPTISLFIYGMISGGYWITFKNTEEAPAETLSILASFAEEVSQSVAARKATISFHGEELLIKGGHALFCTYNFKDSAAMARFDDLGSNICDQFRVIHISMPDYSQILGSIVSLVFVDQSSKQQWTYKLIMLCKLISNTETMDSHTNANNSADNSQANQHIASSLDAIHDRTTSSQSAHVRKSVDLTLRELVKLVTTALLKYFRSLDAYYLSFKDTYGAEYKNMVEKIQLTSDQEQKFSSILKKEIYKWLIIFESSPEKLRTYANLLDTVFRNDSGRHVIEYKEYSLAPSKEVIKSIGIFRSLFPYPKASLPDNDQRVEKFVNPLLEAILSVDKPRQFIVLGEPNTQKSTLIKLVSFIESEIKVNRIPQYWLNLECLSREDVFGDQTYHGILREILMQTNNINLEDKNTNNTTKLNYLFESNNELYRQVSDPRPVSEFKVKKPVDKQSSWIIIDANSSKQNDHFFEKVNYLMTIFGNLYEQKEVNQFIGFSNKLKVIYEMSSIATLEPRHVSGASLIFIGEGLMNLQDRVDQWSSLLNKSHSFFFKMISSKVLAIVKGLVIPVVEHYSSRKADNDRIYALSALSLLNNFLKFYEIFLNEFRKFYIAQDLIEAKSNLENFVAKRKVGSGGAGSGGMSNLAGEQFIYGPGMRMAQQAGGLSMITNARKAKVVDQKIEDDHISAITSKEDLDEFEKRKIEGITLFCLVGAIYPILFCKRPTNLVINIDKYTSTYCAKNNIVKQKFADGIFKVIADKRLGGVSFDLSKYLYDFSKGEWTLWDKVKFQTKIEVSSSFWDDTFSKLELTRLNCKNSPAYYAAKNFNNEEIFTFINPVEKPIIATSNVNHMRYMLDMFMNYKQHTLLMSDHQQGKSIFLGHMYLQDLVEQRELITFNFVLQHKITPKAIQTQIEDSLLKGGNNTVAPPQNKRVIIWIDDLQMSTNKEKPESLVRNLQVQNGWFSSNRKNFINIKDCQFLMTYSLTEYNAELSKQSIEALNTDVLSKCLLLKTHLMSYQNLNSIFFKQVENYIDPYPDSKKEKLASKLFHQFAKVVYFNQDKLRSLSVSLGLNLNLEAFCQLVRTLNLVEWEVLAENPENVLFVWYHSMINFFNSDLDFQGLEFKTIVEEKRSKMAKMIHAPRKSSMFESGNRQRLSAKVNMHLVDMVRGSRLSDIQLPEEAGQDKDSNSSDGGEKDAKKRHSKSVMNPTDAAKNLRLPKMELIIEESDGEESSIKSSNKTDDINQNEGSPENKSIEANIQSKVHSMVNVSGQNSKIMQKSKPITEDSENGAIRKMTKGNKQRNSLGTKLKNSQNESADSSSQSDIMPSESNLAQTVRSVTDPLGLKDTISQLRKENTGADIKTKRGQMPSLDYLSTEITKKDAKRKSDSLKEIDVSRPGSGSTNKSKRSKTRIDPDQDDNPRSYVTSSSSSSKSELSSKDNESHENKSEDDDEMSEDQLADEESIRAEFTIDGSKSGTEYFKDFIFSTMNFKLPGGMKQQDTLKKVCFDKKHIFDEVLIRELKDLRDNKEDNEDHTFVVADAKDEKEIMDFMKTTLSGYIKLNPEAIFALKLDGGNFPLLVKHFNMLAMSIITEFQQIYLSSIKSQLYCKTLIGYVCNSIGCPVDYVDLLNCKATRLVDDKIVRIDAYEYIQDILLHAFPDIWRQKKRIIMVNIPNSAILDEHQPLLDRVLDLISSIVLNSDMLNQHLGDRLKEMIEMPKRDKMYAHYTEFDIKFTIRNRMQARITFILLNDSTENYTEMIKTENSGVRNLDFYSYLNDRYQKLAGKLSKIVINGIKCLEPEDAPSFYSPPLPFEEIEISATIAKCLNTELNYLRCVDKDREHFSLVRPYNENAILINVIRFILRSKFAFLEGESEVSDCNREKTQICQRVDRRREIAMLEVKEIDSQIEIKNKERAQVNMQNDELVKKQTEWEEKKSKLQETTLKLDSNLTELAKEAKMYIELKSGLLETIKAVRDYKDREVQLGVLSSGFTNHKMFIIYSIFFAEMSGLSRTFEKKVVVDSLKGLVKTNLPRDQFKEYTEKFEECLKNFQISFVEILSSLNGSTVSEDTIKALSDTLESISLTSIGTAGFTGMQKVIMKLIDTAIETIKLEQMKTKREVEVIKINETISLLKVQSEKADEFLMMIKEGIDDLPALCSKIDERINFLRSKRETAESSIRKLSEVMLKFNDFQRAFSKVSQPLLNPQIDREALIDLMACYIVVFNKYPFQIKKKMLFVALQNSPISPSLFEEIPLYEILSTDTLMTDIMRSKIPCNSNFLTNLSVIDLLHEEQTVLYPLVVDKGKMFMKWCQAKYSKNICSDRYAPTPNSLSQLEHALKTGSIYVAIDPREELMNLISPIIEWQFRRFTENILTAYNPNIEPSDTITLFGKQIQVGKTFFLCIVLEILHIEEMDQNTISKLLVLDNSILNEGLFCETIADELAMNLENNTRGFYVSEYMNKSIQLTIIERYKKLLERGHQFDFLKDGLENTIFKQLLEDLDVFDLLLESLNREMEERKAALRTYQNNQKDLYSLKLLDARDEEEFRFLNYPFAYKVTGFLKMMSKFLACANRLWIYFLGLEKMKRFVGSGFTISYDILAHLLKFTISISDIKVTSADIENNSPTFNALFSQVEQRAYQALCSMVPGSMHYVFSFILGVLLLKKRSEHKVEFTQHLSLFLLSEKILARPSMPTIISTDLKKMFGDKVELVAEYFRDKECFLPQCLFADPVSVNAAHEELKSGVTNIEKKEEEFAEMSKTTAQTLISEAASRLNSNSDTEVIMVRPSLLVKPEEKENVKIIFDENARSQLSLASFKQSPFFISVEGKLTSDVDCLADEEVKDLMNDLNLTYQEMKPKDLAGFKLTYEQMVKLMSLLVESDLNKEAPLTLTFNKKGELSKAPLAAIKSSGFGQMIGIAGNFSEMVNTIYQSPVSKKSYSKTPQAKASLGFNQITLVNKVAKFRERKSFKTFSQLILQKEKIKKAVVKDFITEMANYLRDIDKVTMVLH